MCLTIELLQDRVVDHASTQL